MPSIEKITPERFPDLYGELLREFDPQIPEATWKLAFTPQWQADEGYFGYALANGDKLVGMLGTLFSVRPVDGVPARFCNLHGWYVKPEHRALSLLLMRPVLALRDYTLTDFTPTPRVLAISKRLGMQRLDHEAVALPPLPLGRSSASVQCEDLTDDVAAARLNASDLQAFRDHAAFDCFQLLVRDGERYCYVVYSLISRHRLAYCFVHWLSNPQLFAEQHAAIRRHLLRKSGGSYVVVESRLLAGVRVPFAFRMQATEKLYRSSIVSPHQIGTLYSEMVLLNHTALPGLRIRLTTAVKACLPAAVRSRLLKPANLAAVD